MRCGSYCVARPKHVLLVRHRELVPTNDIVAMKDIRLTVEISLLQYANLGQKGAHSGCFMLLYKHSGTANL